MAEPYDTRELAAALDGDAGVELTITDLPNDVLVSIFEAVGDLRYVSHTAPCVCKEWAELYRSQDASLLHETLEVDFLEEAVTTAQDARRRGLGRAARAAGQGRSLRTPVVHGSRVISWADGRA